VGYTLIFGAKSYSRNFFFGTEYVKIDKDFYIGCNDALCMHRQNRTTNFLDNIYKAITNGLYISVYVILL
jgi:hypothetical protein